MKRKTASEFNEAIKLKLSSIASDRLKLYYLINHFSSDLIYLQRTVVLLDEVAKDVDSAPSRELRDVIERLGHILDLSEFYVGEGKPYGTDN